MLIIILNPIHSFSHTVKNLSVGKWSCHVGNHQLNHAHFFSFDAGVASLARQELSKESRIAYLRRGCAEDPGYSTWQDRKEASA